MPASQMSTRSALVAPLVIKFPANALGKATAGAQILGPSHTFGRQAGVPGSLLWPDPVQTAATSLGVSQQIDIFFFVFPPFAILLHLNT